MDAASTGPRSVFAWNLVDLKRVSWEGPELTLGKHQLSLTSNMTVWELR
jgi:hypothetical protein